MKQLGQQRRYEEVVVRWCRGETAQGIALALGGLATPSSVETMVRQLRVLGVPLKYRRTSRHDLDILEPDLDLPRLRKLALAKRVG